MRYFGSQDNLVPPVLQLPTGNKRLVVIESQEYLQTSLHVRQYSVIVIDIYLMATNRVEVDECGAWGPTIRDAGCPNREFQRHAFCCLVRDHGGYSSIYIWEGHWRGSVSVLGGGRAGVTQGPARQFSPANLRLQAME